VGSAWTGASASRPRTARASSASSGIAPGLLSPSNAYTWSAAAPTRSSTASPGPDPGGRTALRLSALEFLDRLATILPPPRIHRHRYHGAFAPNAPLRALVTARAEAENAAAAASLAPNQTAIPGPAVPAKPDRPDPVPLSGSGPSSPAAARSSRWAALLARIYEVFPLHPARGPPQTEFLLDLGGPSPEDVAQEWLPDEFDQSRDW
jgi:hypothetical protein